MLTLQTFFFNTCTLVATYVILRRLECTHAKILVSALEHQVSRGDSHDEVVNYWSNLHMPQNRASDIITHVILNIINGVSPKTYIILPSLKISED